MIRPYLDELEAAATEAGVNLRVACEAAGVSHVSLYRWRSGAGANGPSLTVARRIEAAIRFLGARDADRYSLVVAQLIRKRMVLKLSQATVNERIGTATGLVSKWECGDRRPSKFLLQCWATALGVTLTEAQLDAIEISKLPRDPGRASVHEPTGSPEISRAHSAPARRRDRRSSAPAALSDHG